MAQFEKERRRAPAQALPRLEARTLAENYLYRAGHNPKELDAVAPLLQEAGGHRTFAKQLGGAPPPRPWTY